MLNSEKWAYVLQPELYNKLSQSKVIFCHNHPTLLACLRRASNHSQTLANRWQGLNLLRAETALRKGFGKFYEAFALKGKTWIVYRLARCEFYLSPWHRNLSKSRSECIKTGIWAGMSGKSRIFAGEIDIV